jgi:hypothetical protein
MKLPIDEHMVQYVQGYIMAMEDVLRDLDRFRTECESDADIIESLEKETEESRDNARRTLDMIVKKLDAAE